MGEYYISYSITGGSPSDDGNNDIPGKPLPGSPVSATIDSSLDPVDVYSVKLKDNEKLTATLNAGSGLTMGLIVLDRDESKSL